MMQKCLATQIGKNVQVYIDDVVITSKKGATLIEDLKETFDNLDKFCLKLNPTKCSFGVPAELLGFLVSARGIEANPEKIQAIVAMRKPTKLKEIQQLTGRVAALSRFVARLGEKALPFYALIKQGEKFQWNEEADRAFEDLKRKISTPPILVAPKEKEPLLLYIAATPEYEALIHGMKMAKACGATRLKIFGDSQLVAQQVMNQCDAVNDSMVAYKEMYNELEKLFDGCEVNHISRLSNDEADVLANIGSQCLAIPPGVFWEEITERSTKPKKSTKKEKNEKPSGAAKEALEEEEEEEQDLVLMNMNKEFPELFGMLKAAEIEIKKEHQVLMVNKTTSFKKQGKSKGKFKKGGKKAATPPMKPKNGPKPDADCYYCKEKGHRKRNCSKYLADLKSGLVKKKKEGWASSKQCTVAKSSTESEYIAVSEASSEAVWMKRFIVELGVVPSALDPFVIYCDNMGAIANAQEPRSHKRPKHIKLRYH
ncbi:hypothetical protein QYE76_032910 [Lolium multiflorum]|uniref:CCHC-type domain-containing protein n=1 Tax=Lolium multiflorum TaxID=4521 RepID=A0AAD8QWL8_LOLMU|nr:hypothetical protein QYE76_032910 [Lolium multiflorum]